MARINIAIDGYSSCGKSTTAKALANDLGYVYVDTGAMYRAITYYALTNNYINLDTGVVRKTPLINALLNIVLSFKFNEEKQMSEIYINDICVEDHIRNLTIAKWVSPISAIKEVRIKLVRNQQEMAKDKGIVMDGRDIASVVLPDAELKVFMTAEMSKRAERRHAELMRRGDEVSIDEVATSLASRDHQDMHRKESPLVRVPEAVVVDNTNLTPEGQLQYIKDLVEELVNPPVSTEEPLPSS